MAGRETKRTRAEDMSTIMDEGRSGEPVADGGYEAPCPNDERVGYCSPPRHSRFKPGQSGNPRGRPRGSKSVAAVLRDVASRRISVTENGRMRTMSWLEALLTQTMRAALQGEPKATDRTIRLLPAFQAALAEDEASARGGLACGGDGRGSASAGAGSSGFSGAADQALLAFFGEQIARGEISFGGEAEDPGGTDEVFSMVQGHASDADPSEAGKAHSTAWLKQKSPEDCSEDAGRQDCRRSPAEDTWHEDIWDDDPSSPSPGERHSQRAPRTEHPRPLRQRRP